MRPEKQNIIIGAQYNNLTVVAMTERKASNGQRFYTCRCICGNVRDVQKSNIGKVLGCGCVRQAATSHKPRKARQNKTAIAAANIIKQEQAQSAAKPKQTPSPAINQASATNPEPAQAIRTNPAATRIRRKIEDIKESFRLARETNSVEQELNQLLKGC